eukprot:TRINITY_DN27607_c0_g1_i3.p1 TRINITY_DN27607_c0_g1~~TRINITY_DN27607_c0_g1_i3.p1  ORF type:complete len:323 (+),score=49.82 TRINITY_DN27607_c0_g1_i3:323-1291(+)
MLLAEDFSMHPYFLCARDADAFQAALRPSTEAEHIPEMSGDMVTIFRTLQKVAPDLVPPEVSAWMYAQARLSMLSRVFDAADPSSMVPLADLFNHSHDHKSATWRWDPDVRCMVVKADRDHKAGEEIIVSYGPRSNALLYRTYGFTAPPDEECGWTCIIQNEQAHAIYETYLPETRRFVTIMLDSQHLDESLVDVLNLVGKAAQEFLRLVCARVKYAYDTSDALRVALEALTKARELDPTSHAWWAHLPADHQHLRDEPVMRVKMSEYLCLIAHLEALDCFEGVGDASRCLSEGSHLREVLAQGLTALAKGRNFKLTYVDGP